MIGINKFLDILYSLLYKDEIDSVEIVDIAEIVKIIYSSDEFQIISSRLDINDFTEKNIEEHRYTVDIDQYGIVSFNVPDSNKIINSNKFDAGYIQQAINKRALTKYIADQTENIVNLKYDSPSGVYNMPKAELADCVADSVLFTDGICKKNDLRKSEDSDSITRSVQIENATFSLFAYCIDGMIDQIEARGKFLGDYNILLSESKRILNGFTDSYDEIVSESPKVYKFKRH